ncbi:MAG: sensor domain-containing diguanylate cyclase [Cellvibrionaceae bacterium]
MTNTQDSPRSRHTVSSLLERIEENQQIQARFHDYEFRLLACRRLPELLEQLLSGAASHFDLAGVSLTLLDPDYSIHSLVEHLDLGDYERRLQLYPTAEFFDRLFGRKPTVKLGVLDGAVSADVFPGVSDVGSAALLPLMRQDRLLGSLNFASRSSTRYSADKGVSFMWHLASMVAICLENCVALEQLQRQGQEDTLTQVRNRRSFDEEFIKELERAQRQGEPLSCLFADIDYFKQINDAYGHQVGDRCLRRVAQLIAGELRKTDLLARYGGEEFVVLLPGCPGDEAIITAERVRLAVANQPMALSLAESVPLTISVGLATWIPDQQREDDLNQVGEQLIQCADRAMYQAKQAGRNKVCVEAFAETALAED